ncbi:DUF4133 domain-containing protein [Paraflavitalea sp. CAU 1676]|uniref:DUF4133 domain-containing protein n=1 Tax=Paraflavitalea sp. CAU 1676 TaxID=3032598 RepID=UPI0023DA587B|nr:DUF4133 domain-containing protein [Paraflavitalea sp. CAU 1676]MDF2188713.1 DUF4133 domain-containing protein [Paraflavitalea sp. CAU 1676]
MPGSVYKINKGVNRSVEFKGLKAQYIWYLGGGLLVCLILYVILYIVGLNSYICLAIVGSSATSVFVYVFKLNNKYGEHGMMKSMARRQVPRFVRCKSRKCFIEIK